jgi:NodT family efflux transporter outer membrane factor (OMF) lipoprotein
MRVISKNLKLVLLGSLLLPIACAVGPDYVRPETDVPATYKELPEGWKIAAPRDDESRGAWWTIYNDAILNALEAQIDVSNQNLKAAEAAYRAARAAVSVDQASLFPTLSVSGAVSHANTHELNQMASNVTGNAAWDVDVWGRIRRTVESDEANAQASEADLAAARLSAQAALATDYFSLRVQDRLKKLLDETVAGQKRSLKIAEDQYKSGVAAKADVVAAQEQLESTQAQAINAGLLRAQFEHAIAALLGKTPDKFSLVPAELKAQVPVIPVAVPSTLLERRPDIAAAERRMVAANAQIGVAVAAFFPDLTLSASAGYASTVLSKLFQASNSFWSYGPALAETIFDAGARSARVDIAQADYDQNVALYRQTVLASFQQVEDQLAALRILAQQADVETSVVKSAHEAERLVLNQYKAGIVPYSSVIVAQTSTLSNEQTALFVFQNRLTASTALIEALGGGWDTKSGLK